MEQKQYKDEELKRLQALNVSLLAEIDRVCKLLSIDYFVYGGTTIGVIRHKGFIPWDDDVDLCMLRPDYERFMQEAPALLSERFELVSKRSNPYFPAALANLCLKGTVCTPEVFMDNPFVWPLGVDIFAFDALADDAKTRNKQLRSSFFWGRLIVLRHTGTPYVAPGTPHRKLVLAVSRFAHGLLKLCHISPMWLQKHWEKAARLAEGTTTRQLTDFTPLNPLEWACTREELFPVQRLPFESIEVNVPHDYDSILTRGYGDYMSLPPQEERKNHHPGQLDFGEYAQMSLVDCARLSQNNEA